MLSSTSPSHSPGTAARGRRARTVTLALFTACAALALIISQCASTGRYGDGRASISMPCHSCWGQDGSNSSLPTGLQDSQRAPEGWFTRVVPSTRHQLRRVSLAEFRQQARTSDLILLGCTDTLLDLIIRFFTRSAYSHVSVIYRDEAGDDTPYLFHSNSYAQKDVWLGQDDTGVQLNDIDYLLNEHRSGALVVWRRLEVEGDGGAAGEARRGAATAAMAAAIRRLSGTPFPWAWEIPVNYVANLVGVPLHLGAMARSCVELVVEVLQGQGYVDRALRAWTTSPGSFGDGGFVNRRMLRARYGEDIEITFDDEDAAEIARTAPRASAAAAA